MIIRDEKGKLIAHVADGLAGKMINCNMGKWRPYQQAGKQRINVYEVTTPFDFGTDYMRLSLWEGYIFIPSDY